MSKSYQTIDAAVQAMAVPDRVSVAMNEIAADVTEGLFALAVGAGLQVMQAMFAEDVSALCGPKGRHDPDRTGYRHGTEAGSVSLGGRRVPVTRPRVRASNGSRELPVASYEVLGSSEVLGRMVMEADARGAVGPPLPDRLGTGRCCGPGRRVGHEPGGGVAEVRGPDRDRTR